MFLTLFALQLTLLRCVALRCVALRCVALRCVALRCVALQQNRSLQKFVQRIFSTFCMGVKSYAV
ncbi:hypothetical protein [Histophilus somni]|uniref:hypothetical protein n=1 Tax=Histophilus somni TaxID=731 RepID=UPI000A701C0C|nr:hypothetical protein [Histophilus somni]